MRGKLILIALIAALLPLPSSAFAGGPTTNSDENPYNGYWWNGAWVPGYISIEGWYRRAPTYSYGGAVFYAPNLMEATAAYRGYSLDGYVDGVAMMSPADIGRTVWLRRSGGEWEGPFLVVDCARRGDFWPIAVLREEVVEVGFQTAVRWGMAVGGPGWWHTRTAKISPVEVWVGEWLPRYLTDETMDGPRPIAINYPEWVETGAAFATPLTEHRRRPVWKGDGCWRWQDDRLLCADDFPAEPLTWALEMPEGER